MKFITFSEISVKFVPRKLNHLLAGGTAEKLRNVTASVLINQYKAGRNWYLGSRPETTYFAPVGEKKRQFFEKRQFLKKITFEKANFVDLTEAGFRLN